MNTVLKAVSIVALGAIGAGGMMMMCHNCPKREAMLQDKISQGISKYVENNPELILEKIAKTEKFTATVKNLALASDEDIKAEIHKYLENNQHLIVDAVNANPDMFVNAIVNSEAFKNSLPTVKAQENDSNAENSEAQPETDPNLKYVENWEKLSNNPISPYVGPKDAKVTVVEFFDFACSHCKTMGPLVNELIKNNPDVKFVFQPLFFISEHSPYAAKVAVAAFKKGKFREVFEGIITLPELTEESINQIVADEGLNVDEIKAMVEDKEIRRGVQDIDALSQLIGVGGVPLLLVNGKELHGRDYYELQRQIDALK